MSDFISNKTLNLYPIDFPFETLVARMNPKNRRLILDPDFQRTYKWDVEGWVRASRFIESCLMRIPLPSCYFAETESGEMMVIDGVQRLTTIQKFFNDEFALEGLTSFKELEGKKFSELGIYKLELENTTIRTIVLRKENPANLIVEIFSRLNQGAVKLTPQEIRHALHPGYFDQLLGELANNEIIKNFGMQSKSDVVRDGRSAEEQVLRFFAFSDDLDLNNYDGVLGNYLNNCMEKNAKLDINVMNEYRDKFKNAIRNCVEVFGLDDVFKDITRRAKKHGLVHYDLLMPTIGLMDEKYVLANKVKLLEAYKKLCISPAFRKTLSGGLQQKSSISKRRKLWNSLLENV